MVGIHVNAYCDLTGFKCGCFCSSGNNYHVSDEFILINIMNEHIRKLQVPPPDSL